MANLVFLLAVANAFTSRKQLRMETSNSLPSFYAPPSSFNTQPKQMSLRAGSSLTSSLSAAEDFHATADAWASQNLQLADSDKATISRSYLDKSTGLYHCYMYKESQGLEIVNSVAQMTMSADGKVLTNSNSWVDTKLSPPRLVKREAQISCTDALSKVAATLKEVANPAEWNLSQDGKATLIQNVPFTIKAVRCEEKLYQTEKEGLKHVYSMTVPTPTQYLNLMVDMANGNILAAADYTSHIAFTPSGRLVTRHVPSVEKRQVATSASRPTFRALQLGALDPRTVPSSLISDPVDFVASPNGWNARSSTSGNNVIAVDNSGNSRDTDALKQNGKQAVGNNFLFDFSANDRTQSPADYTDAAITNAFFLSNRFHDIMYQYGFDERAGNFQQDNFGKGGQGGDPVLALVHDGSGKNNANFASPPDGESGIMRMFIFTRTTPNRDGALENAVVVHELAHGLSTRLTGGPATSNCLSRPEGGGLGEGWSDIVAMVLEMESIDTRDTPKVIGQYVTNNATAGVRRFGYSTDLNRNPSKYSDVQQSQQVHFVGEIWASMLFEVYWNMVDKAGFDRSFRTNPQGNKGNNQFLKTLVAAMKIQPCFPTFVTARDAFLAADKQISNGQFQCEIIKGFAKRGLGANVKDDGKFVDDFTVFPNCQ